MRPEDLPAAMQAIYEEMWDTTAGASAPTLVKAFLDRYSEEELAELEHISALKRILDAARNCVRKNAPRGAGEQLVIPGLGKIDRTVTCLDGEGNYVHKSVRRASTSDLRADLEIHDKNVASANEAKARALLRNDTIIPIMEEYGLDEAGPAIDRLIAEGISNELALGDSEASGYDIEEMRPEVVDDETEDDE